MAIKPVYTGVDAIMSAVDSFLPAAPYVSLWNGKLLLAQFNQKGKVEDTLREILENAKEVGNTDVFLLKFHPTLTNGWVTEKTPVVTTLPVQVLTRNESLGGQKEWLPSGEYQNRTIAGIKELLLPIGDRLTALENREPVEDIDPVDKWLDRLNHPAVGSLITALAAKFVPGLAMQSLTSNLQVSGVPGDLPEWDEGLTEDQIGTVNMSLDQLKAAGMDIDTDLAKLAAMSKENTSLFNMLLGQLRSQK